MAFAESQGDVAAHRMPDRRAAGDAQRPESVGHRVGQILHRVNLSRDDRDAVARQVERHHADVLVKIRYELLPDQQRFEVAVQQHDAPVAPFRVADVQGRPPRHDEFFGHMRSFSAPFSFGRARGSCDGAGGASAGYVVPPGCVCRAAFIAGRRRGSRGPTPAGDKA